MPCYTITTVKLELKNANLDLLRKALENLGFENVQANSGLITFRESWYAGYYNPKTGIFEFHPNMTKSKIEQVKKAYSAEIVKQQAKRFGWQLKETSQYKYEIIKR